MSPVESERKEADLAAYRSGRVKHCLRAFLRGPVCVLPNFLILGGQKCGSTSLYNYLVQHPNVMSAVYKEVYYFDRYYHRGINWYKACFPSRKSMSSLSRKVDGAVITGEASASYLSNPVIAPRVMRDLDHPRLIVVLRDPVERAYSHYLHNLRKGRETLSFEEALEQEEQRINPEMERMLKDPSYDSYDYLHYSYRTKGLYADQLRRWIDVAGRDNVLVLDSEGFFADRAGYLDKVVEFLVLPPWKLDDEMVYNNADNKQEAMSKVTRESLERFYRPHNEDLFKLIGVRFNWS